MKGIVDRGMMRLMDREMPKSVKRSLRELAGRAHEIALRRALVELSQDFDAWKQETIDSFELAHRIHEFHQGPDRQIHLRYTRSVDLPFLVVQSIREGLIDRESVPPEALPYLDSTFALFREIDKEKEDESEPGGLTAHGGE